MFSQKSFRFQLEKLPRAGIRTTDKDMDFRAPLKRLTNQLKEFSGSGSRSRERK